MANSGENSSSLFNDDLSSRATSFDTKNNNEECTTEMLQHVKEYFVIGWAYDANICPSDKMIKSLLGNTSHLPWSATVDFFRKKRERPTLSKFLDALNTQAYAELTNTTAATIDIDILQDYYVLISYHLENATNSWLQKNKIVKCLFRKILGKNAPVVMYNGVIFSSFNDKIHKKFENEPIQYIRNTPSTPSPRQMKTLYRDTWGSAGADNSPVQTTIHEIRDSKSTPTQSYKKMLKKNIFLKNDAFKNIRDEPSALSPENNGLNLGNASKKLFKYSQQNNRTKIDKATLLKIEEEANEKLCQDLFRDLEMDLAERQRERQRERQSEDYHRNFSVMLKTFDSKLDEEEEQAQNFERFWKSRYGKNYFDKYKLKKPKISNFFSDINVPKNGIVASPPFESKNVLLEDDGSDTESLNSE